MNQTVFKISKMDCPSEEQMIRMKLSESRNIRSLQFDIPARTLTVMHTKGHEEIFRLLDSLKFDTIILESKVDVEAAPVTENTKNEKKLLWQVLFINAFFFILESVAGFLSDSMGLIADGLDMLADTLVYGMALFAVGGSLGRKNTIAKLAGYFQLALAFIGFTEVVRRFLGYGELPEFRSMMIVSALALAGNATCLYLLQKSKNREAHMQASMIFTSNDVIVNLGVIAAGLLVFLTGSPYPDLIIGTAVFGLVINGAFKILKLSK